MSGTDIITLITAFVLSAFVGFEVISKVPSILHTPLMSGTNAIHGVVLVGSMAILGTAHGALEITLGFIAVVLSTLNVVGGFVVTDRMLEMFKGRQPGRPTAAEPAADFSPVEPVEATGEAPRPPAETPGPSEEALPVPAAEEPTLVESEVPAPEATVPVAPLPPEPPAEEVAESPSGLDEPTQFLSPEDMPPPPLDSEATELLPRIPGETDETQVVPLEDEDGERS